MQQMVITYMLSGLANIADVNPRDVHTSLLSGNVRVDNLSLRPETLNKFLPLPIEEGVVPELEVQIPNPSTAAPMEVMVRRARLRLPLDLSSPPVDRTAEQILRGITPQSILGTAGVDAAEPSSEPSTPVSEPELAAYHYGPAISDVGEDDFASCASDSDLSDSESVTSGGSDIFGSPASSDIEAPAAGPDKAGGGWVDYLRARATQSVEWIWRRQLRITVTDLTLILPCDARKHINFEITTDSFVVTVEPTQVMGAAQRKIIHIGIGGASVFASAGDARSRVLVVESLSIKITTVYEASTERVLRKNMFFSFNGTNTLTADELTLFALLKCHLSRQIRLSVPSYCLPFANLRARGSLWSYTRSCVLHGLRYYKQRYNFNASHLRFYAHARERYLQLLRECHRSQSVAEHRQELADVEQDLRYEDVIHYLRRLVQDKFAVPATKMAIEEAANEEPHVVSSTHLEWKLIKLVLPARNTIFVRRTALVARNEESIFTIASISLDADGAVQTMAVSSQSASTGMLGALHTDLDEESALLYVHVKDDHVSRERKISLQPLAVQGSIEGTLRCLTPIAEALQRIGEQEQSGATTPLTSSAASPLAAQVVPLSTIVAIHRVEVQLGAFDFLLDHLSCTTVTAPDAPTKMGCTLRECHLRHRSDFVLAPLEVRMTPQGTVIVSQVTVEVTTETWAVWREDADGVRLLLDKLPRLGSAPSSPSLIAARHSAVDVSVPMLTNMTKVLQWSAPSNCPPIEVEDITFHFLPLDFTATVQGLAVHTVSPSLRGPFGQHITASHVRMQSHYTGRLALAVVLADGFRVGKSVDPVAAVVLSIPSTNISGRKSIESEELPLLALSELVSVAHSTIRYATVADVSLADSTRMTDVAFLYKTDPTVTPVSDRPRLTSFMQVAATVTCIDGPALCLLPSRALFSVLTAMYHFACAELIPEEYYRVFFSSFSDTALQVVMRDCVVKCGARGQRGEGELLVSFDNQVAEDRVSGLDQYRPHLAVTPQNYPILIFYDVQQLAMRLEAAQTTMRVTVPASGSSSYAALTVGEMNAVLPLDKMPFWCAEVQQMVPVPWRLSVEIVRALACSDAASRSSPVLKAVLEALRMETVTGTAAGAPTLGGSFAVSQPKEMPLSPSGSDRCSCVSSAEEPVETTQVSLRRWGVEVDFSVAMPEYVKLCHLLQPAATVAAGFTRRQVLRCNVYGADFHLDDCGNIFLDAPAQLIELEGCTFTAPSADRHVVVCPSTSVVFRRCVFAHPGGCDLIRSADPSALYICEDCRVEEAPAPPSVDSVRTAAALSVPTPNGSVAEAGPPQRRRTQVTVEEGSFSLQLDATSRLHGTQRALTFTSKHKQRHSFCKLRNSEMRIEYVDAEQRIPLLAKTSFEGEVSMQLPRRSCSASCSVGCGDITIPLFASKVRAVRDRVELLLSSLKESAAAVTTAEAAASVPEGLLATSYVVPEAGSDEAQQCRHFPFDSWKLLLSFSLIPIGVQLPGGLKVANIVFSNAFVWSKREPLAEAMLEARFALHSLGLWEWHQQRFQAVVSSPLFVGVQGRMLTPTNVTATVSVSPVEASVSTDQVRLFLYALRSQTGDATSTAIATNGNEERKGGDSALSFLQWRNHTGVALQARGANGVVIHVPSTETPERIHGRSSAIGRPLFITEIDGTAVDHVERDTETQEAIDQDIQPGELPPLFSSRKTVVLTDKRRFHLTSTLDRNFVHTITVRTLVHVENNTPLALFITAGGEASHVIEPFTQSSVPQAMMHRADLSVAMGRSETGATTLREPLFPDSMSATEFSQRCYQQRYPAADASREFVSLLDGSSTFLVSECELRAAVVLLRFRAARPFVVNDTVYPLRVEALNAREDVLACEDIAPGKRAYFLQLPPATDVHGRLQLFVGSDVYTTREDVAVFDRDAARADANIVMAHQEYPRRFFFELNLSVESSGPAGRHGVAITAGYQCLLKNCTSMDLFFSTEDGDAVGSIATEGLLGSSPPGAVGYVPVGKTVCLYPRGGTLSEPFEIDVGGGGCVIQCDHFPTVSPYAASFFLLRTVPNGHGCMAEVLPAVIFHNRHPRLTLCVKHAIREVGGTRILEEVVFEVSPLRDYHHHTLSKYGYTNDLMFAWRSNDQDGTPQTYSFVMETDLAPGTTWSGFVSLGTTHHQLDISKDQLYDPAFVTVGPAVLPRVILVNFSHLDFRDVPRYTVAFPQPSKNSNYVLLATVDGIFYTVDLLQEDPLELEPGLFVQTIHAREEELCSVVLTSTRALLAKEKMSRTEMQVSVNVQVGALSLWLRDASAVPLHVLCRSLAIHVMWWGQTTSVQSSATGLSIESHYGNEKSQVVEPFDADLSLREMKRTTRDVYLKGLHVGLQPLTITISDVLLYQLQMATSRCFVDNPFDLEGWLRQSKTCAILKSLPTSAVLLLHIGNASIAETPLELSWDRHVRPPRDFIFGDSAVSNLIPSLHHALLVLPKLQLRKVSRVTLAELLGRVQQVLLMEVIKQIPKMVTTVGFFKKNTSLLEKLTSTVSSFLFRPSKETDTTDDGSSALI